MKAIEQYFPAVLFIMLYKMALAFETVDEILKCDHSNENYWAVLSCGAVYYAVQRGSVAFETVDEILKCDHSNESYWAVLSCGAVYHAVQGCSTAFESMGEINPNVWPFLNKVVLTSEYVEEILKWDRSNESYWAVLSCDAVYYAVQGGSIFLVCW